MEVLRQEAPAYKITITEQDVQGQIDQIKQMFQGDQAKFDAALEKQNLTLEQLTQSIERPPALGSDESGGDQGVDGERRGGQGLLRGSQGRFRAAGVSGHPPHPHRARSSRRRTARQAATPTQADWDAAKAEAEKVRSEIQNGADFVTEAEKYSDDATTKDSGGELGR